VLRKGDNIRQIHYDAAPLRFSDHRPVYATFQVIVQRIDEKKKDAMKAELYGQRREVVGDTRAGGRLGDDETDDEDLIGYESVEPGLPPASSDRRKWWLDNGTYLLPPLLAWILIFPRSTSQSAHPAAL
jgi:hypothetical protein